MIEDMLQGPLPFLGESERIALDMEEAGLVSKGQENWQLTPEGKNRYVVFHV